jgi:hypothetical protein
MRFLIAASLLWEQACRAPEWQTASDLAIYELPKNWRKR